jgi:hypothetical protein
MLTIPIIGWVAKLGPGRGRLCSYSITKYGPQTDNDWQWYPDAGNGISTATGQAITNNNPNDANMPVGTNFQAGWIQHLTNRWGTAVNGGLRYFILDNEWSLWHETHRDVHPVGATMDEVRNKFVESATMIKDIDPGALIVGPEEWGWSGYLYSGYDLQWGNRNGWSNLPDRAAHGGMDFLPWFLQQISQRSTAAGRRLLDVFTVHYYPQGGEFGNDTSTAMQLRRNRSTRSLWDPNYTDESWINDRVRLIPRLKQWMAQYFPGTPIGITEYSWGAENHINGATTQADVLGILGREGLDLATRWVVPGTGTPAFKVFQMYRNYDGNKSAFGETNVSAIVPNPDNISAFAAMRSSDGALTVMVVNKVLGGGTPLTPYRDDDEHGTATLARRPARPALCCRVLGESVDLELSRNEHSGDQLDRVLHPAHKLQPVFLSRGVESVIGIPGYFMGSHRLRGALVGAAPHSKNEDRNDRSALLNLRRQSNLPGRHYASNRTLAARGECKGGRCGAEECPGGRFGNDADDLQSPAAQHAISHRRDVGDEQ